MELYDLIVIGGGPTGYNAAEYAAKHGMKVLIAECGEMGGTCLNVGCIPTKAFLYAAKMFTYAKGGNVDYGVRCGTPEFHHEAVVNKKNEMVQILVRGVEARLRKHKVTVVRGEASVDRVDGQLFAVISGEKHQAKQLLIAAGSSPAIPPIEGAKASLESGFMLTSNEILSLTNLPKHLVIIGGGVIGFEMAAYFHEAGVNVTVVEMLDKVLGDCDREISSMLQKKLEVEGVKFHLSARVLKISDNTVIFDDGSQSVELLCDKVLMAAGRKANIDIDGLDKLGVSISKGVIAIDDCCRTNAANVYAAGDVVGKVTLAHVGYREGEVAVNHMLGISDQMDYSAISSIVYTNPEAAFVGMNEEEAEKEGIAFRVKKISINFSGRHVIEHGMDDGICKLIIEKKKEIIIGAAVLSDYASEYIYSLALMIQNKIPVTSIKKTVFPHPTVSEIIREALME